MLLWNIKFGFDCHTKIFFTFSLDYGSWLLRHTLNFYKCTYLYGGPVAQSV